MKKLKTFDLDYFTSKSHFGEDGVQNYLVFQPMLRYLKRVSFNSDHVASWKSKGFSDKSIKFTSSPSNFLNPSLDYHGHKLKVKFSGSSLSKTKLRTIMEQ